MAFVKVLILRDGSVILDDFTTAELGDEQNIENAAREQNDQTGKFLGRLMLNDASGMLQIRPGHWEPDPNDTRNIPDDAKRRVWVDD